MEYVTHDVGLKSTLNDPEENSPEYAPPGQPFAFNVWK
jgi:hypothetical protein